MAGLFGVIAGPRLGGKSTAAGTLPGKTYMLQAAVKETGSRSAKALAKKLGNDLTIDTFADLNDLRAKLCAAAEADYNHIFIDGYSAINDMRYAEPDIQKLSTKNVWDAYAKHGHDMTILTEWIKGITQTGKNVFITCALKIKKVEGGPEDVELEAKGRVAVTSITKLGELCVTVTEVPTEEGVQRVFITRNWGNYPGRIDGVLDEDNPQFVAPDLSKIINLADGDAA